MLNTDDPVIPLPVGQWLLPALNRIVEDMGGKPIAVHRLMAHSPQLLAAWWDFRNYSVNGGQLGKKLGEIVILRTGVHLGAWYEWGSHYDRGLRCGLTREEIDRVLEREVGPQWADDEAELLHAVDELFVTHRISPACEHSLRHWFSPAQIMDVIAIHGMYVILGGMINTWGLDLDPEVAARIEELTSKEQFASAVKNFNYEG